MVDAKVDYPAACNAVEKVRRRASDALTYFGDVLNAACAFLLSADAGKLPHAHHTSFIYIELPGRGQGSATAAVAAHAHAASQFAKPMGQTASMLHRVSAAVLHHHQVAVCQHTRQSVVMTSHTCKSQWFWGVCLHTLCCFVRRLRDGSAMRHN